MAIVEEVVVKWARDNPNRLIDLGAKIVAKNTQNLKSSRNDTNPLPQACPQIASRPIRSAKRNRHSDIARPEVASRSSHLKATRSRHTVSERPTRLNAQVRQTPLAGTPHIPAKTGTFPSSVINDGNNTYSPNHTQQLNHLTPTTAIGPQHPPSILITDNIFEDNTMMQHPNTHGGLLNLQNDEDHGQINPGMRSPGALMLLAPTSDANIPLISRLDAVRYPRSQIYRDSLSNVLRDYKNYQFRLPPGCGSTMTVNGYDSDGGHLIELTFQNSHRGAIGYKFNLPINIVERTSKQETDVDVILGQDYVIQVTSEYERIGVIGHPSLLLPNHLHGDVFSMTQQGLYDNQSGTSAPQNSAISSLDYRFPSGFFMQEPDNASYSNITNPASYSNEPFPAGSGQQEQSPRGKEHLDSTTDIDMSSSQPGDFSFPGLFNANL